jgi:DNA invertase Pin-like site-specific DNA recombinase
LSVQKSLGELHAKGVGLYLHQQGIDTTTPAGKALFQMLGVFAEFERAMIRERVMAGLARAKAQDKKLGPPEVSDRVKAAIRRKRARGYGIRKIAGLVSCGVRTVQKVITTTQKATAPRPDGVVARSNAVHSSYQGNERYR